MVVVDVVVVGIVVCVFEVCVFCGVVVGDGVVRIGVKSVDVGDLVVYVFDDVDFILVGLVWVIVIEYLEGRLGFVFVGGYMRGIDDEEIFCEGVVVFEVDGVVVIGRVDSGFIDVYEDGFVDCVGEIFSVGGWVVNVFDEVICRVVIGEEVEGVEEVGGVVGVG